MSVDTSTRKVDYSMTAITDYTFAFRALTSAPTDIKAKITLKSTDVVTALTYTTDYTVVINSNGIGGTLSLVTTYGTTHKLTIYRETTDLQESDYNNYNQFPADTVETDLDRRTLKSQEIIETLGRCLQLDVSSTVTSITLPPPSTGKALVWTGNTIRNSTYDIDTQQTAAASSATAALASQVAAAASEANALIYANTASTQATASATSATASLSHVTTALTYSNIASSHSVTALTHSNTASSYSTNALTNATTAASHSVTALTHSNTASSYSVTALTHATTASSHATTSITNSTLAGNYASTASTQAALAGNYASTASTQAIAAATSATTASSHATTALTAATNAIQAATNATTAAATSANTALSNLASVAVNDTISPATTGTIGLGTTVLRWLGIYARTTSTETLILSNSTVAVGRVLTCSSTGVAAWATIGSTTDLTTSNSWTIGDNSSGDVTLTFDGDAGTDGTLKYDVSEDVFEFTGGLTVDNAAPPVPHSAFTCFWLGGDTQVAGKSSAGAGNYNYFLHNCVINSGAGISYVINDEAEAVSMGDGVIELGVAAAATGATTFVARLRATTAGANAPTGIRIGSDAANNNIDDASGGTGTVTMYIGNAAITVAFTGHHYYRLGDMDLVTGESVFLKNGKIYRTTKAQDKTCIGIYHGITNFKDSLGNEYLEEETEEVINGRGEKEKKYTGKVLRKSDKKEATPSDYTYSVACLGDSYDEHDKQPLAGAWVTVKAGKIENGDYLCSSDKAGYLEKQADDLLHSYTVGQAREDINADTKKAYIYLLQ